MCKNMHIRHLTNLNFNFLKNSLSKNLYILTKGSFYSLHLQISLVLIEGNLLHKAGQIQRQAVSNGFHHIVYSNIFHGNFETNFRLVLLAKTLIAFGSGMYFCLGFNRDDSFLIGNEEIHLCRIARTPEVRLKILLEKLYFSLS